MAVKNYTLKEAVEIIAKGKDSEAIADLGKRFPILSIKIARLAAKAEKEIIDLMQYMPEYLTIKKVNNAVKTVNDSKAEAEDATEAENKPVEEETAKEVEEPEEKENKPVEPKKRGRKPKVKVKAIPVEEPTEAEVEDEADEEPTEAEETADNYEGKKAVDLFKLCKSRGLKVTTKKSAKYYIDVLEKDDEAKAEAKKAEEAEDDEDEWDIEDEPKEVKKPKKSAFIEEAEDDESWDI
nr:MAG: recombination endonuclease VII [Bacteriophage sp.]